MAYYGNRRYSGRGSSRNGKKKYTQSERIAFRLGLEQKVKKSISSGKTNTRVYDAYCAGFNGLANKKDKPLT